MGLTLYRICIQNKLKQGHSIFVTAKQFCWRSLLKLKDFISNNSPWRELRKTVLAQGYPSKYF